MTAIVGKIARVWRVVRNPLNRKYSSALFRTGDEAKDSFSVITPHIDAEERFKDVSSLEDNINRRGLTVKVDNIQALWNMLKRIDRDKTTLETRRIHIASKIKDLKVRIKESSEEMDKLKMHGKLLRDDLKTTTKAVWELEKKVILRILSLPNDLHDRTPSSESEVVFQFGEEPAFKAHESHLEVGRRLGVVEYFSAGWYYLKHQAAIFELSMLDYFSNEFSNKSFINFCNSDFSRSVVVEGCGLDHENPDDTFILEDIDEILENKDINRLHLVGGASLVSFCSFHAKEIIPSSSLPLRLVAVGRQYIPNNQDEKLSGLFTVCQSSSVGFFVSTEDHKSEVEEFDGCMTLIIEMYKKLGYPFRIVYLPAKDLKRYESLRASVQMFSPHLGSYIEVGHVSMCGSYISKRLLMRHGREEDLKFTHVVYGTAVSVPRLLGCLLEIHHDVTDFTNIPVPDAVKKFSS